MVGEAIVAWATEQGLVARANGQGLVARAGNKTNMGVDVEVGNNMR